MAQTDVLDYIRNTPHNSNVNVVKGMLNTEADGGGGSSDYSYATITATYTAPEGVESLDGMVITAATLYTETGVYSYGIQYSYGAEYLPVADLGSISQLKIPIYKEYPTKPYIQFDVPDTGMLIIDSANSTIISGDAEYSNYELLVSGDCAINFALGFAD